MIAQIGLSFAAMRTSLLLIANGHVQDNVSKMTPSATYAQPLQLFENRGGRFEDVGGAAGESLTRPMGGRALAIGDVNNDGKLDVLVSNLEGAPRLLMNQTQQAGNWLTVRLRGRGTRASPVDGAGAIVTAQVGGKKIVRVAGSGGSYLSASDARVHLGIGSAKRIERLTIRWPSGVRQSLEKVEVNQFLNIAEQ